MVFKLKNRNNVMIIVLVLMISLISLTTGMLNNNQSDDKASAKGPYQSQYTTNNPMTINTCPALPCSGGWNGPNITSSG